MSPRERTVSFRCAENGCRETTFYGYRLQREYKEIIQSQKRHPFKCTRHANPERNLRPGNETTRSVLVASRVRSRLRPGLPDDGWLPGLFWLKEGTESGGSGFTHGDGYNAHASDFPEGTRLVVTAQIEMPEVIPVSEDTDE